MIHNLGGMVALGVGVFGHGQRMLGTKLDAKPTALAPFIDDVNEAVWYLDTVPI
jgi:hypothetical protein